MGGIVPGVLDRMAAADIFDEMRDLPVRTVHRGFKNYTFEKVHQAVGTSDLTDEAASFWFHDTHEIIRFFILMCTFAMVFTIQLWSYLSHVRWGYVNAGQSPDDPDTTMRTLAIVYAAALACGWTMWLGIAFCVGWRQYRDTQANGTNDESIMPKLVRRVAPSVWAPVEKKMGIWRNPIHDTRPQAWRFSVPIVGIHDGEVLYSHEELIDELIFGKDIVEKEVRKKRKKWKRRLFSWYPPSVREGFEWALARRAIVEDYTGHISKPQPKAGRYFIDYDEEAAPDEPMRSKDLRRIVWLLMWVPSGAAMICEVIRNWIYVMPQTGIGWLSFAGSATFSTFILWMQISIQGSKLAERWDREGNDSDNIFTSLQSRYS